MLSATAELTRRLVDDAALFPPGNAPMPRAVARHFALTDQWYAPVVGPFLCLASRLDELCTTLPDEMPAALHDAADGRLGIGVIIDTGTGGVAPAVDRVERDDRLHLRWLEIPLRAETGLADNARRLAAGVLAADVPLAYVEVPRVPGMEGALDVLAEHDLRAKLRTGGVTAEFVPTEHELAAFIDACLDRELPFKLTAGLHHPVRHVDQASGLEQHGFLNVIAGVDAALGGADAGSVADILAVRDSGSVATAIRALDGDRARRARNWFVSYGSCSLTEPIDDLVRLGLLAPADFSLLDSDLEGDT